MERQKSEAALQHPASKDLVVFSILRDSQCVECGEALWKGNFLFMEKERPLCLACADLDQLVYLPRGDAALTRRAKKHSTLSAVVVRFSRARGHYERQGILVEEPALQKAEHECIQGVLPARLRKLGFLWGQDAADGGSADVERACNLGFADALPV